VCQRRALSAHWTAARTKSGHASDVSVGRRRMAVRDAEDRKVGRSECKVSEQAAG
jgi:hypothetical protein